MQQSAQPPDSSIAQFFTQLVQLPPASATQQEQQEQHALPLAQQEQQQQQQLQQQHGHGSSSAAAAAGAREARQLPAQQMPFAPVRFSSRTHLLDPNTGAVMLPPKAAADAGTSAAAGAGAVTTHARHQTRHKQQPHHHHHQQQQQQQQPMHPETAAHTASRQRPIDRSNLGYKLLAKAGWQEGQGLGASEQGMAAPLAVSWHKGNTGLGFSKQQQPGLALPQHPAAAADAGTAAAAGAASGAAAAAGPVLGGKRVAALVAAELASEDLDTKVKRHRQLREQKAKEERDKAIQSYLYRAFNDVEVPDSNPLLAKSHRLTATNPLLD